jgi:hypothetical protein
MGRVSSARTLLAWVELKMAELSRISSRCHIEETNLAPVNATEQLRSSVT